MAARADTMPTVMQERAFVIRVITHWAMTPPPGDVQVQKFWF